jgi:hypothetical protein
MACANEIPSRVAKSVTRAGERLPDRKTGRGVDPRCSAQGQRRWFSRLCTQLSRLSRASCKLLVPEALCRKLFDLDMQQQRKGL